MEEASFTVRIVRPNPHRAGTITWRAGELVTAMAGCDVRSIVSALEALERDTTRAGVGNPARWLSHFAGLESRGSGKQIEPWLEFRHDGQRVTSVARYRALLRSNHETRRPGASWPMPDLRARATFRESQARHFHALVQIERQEIFGPRSADYEPANLPHDASTMFAGYVGRHFRPRSGLLFLGINPGGGGDAYTARTQDDELLYPLLIDFKQSTGRDVPDLYERINDAFAQVVRRWNLWRILEPTLSAAGAQLSEVAYMNVVPYRTRGDKRPPAAATRKAWELVVDPTMKVLGPRALITLGKNAGTVVSGLCGTSVPHYCVPRTRGDKWVSPDAIEVHRVMRRELAGKG
jgi:hypothetical protein